MVPIVYIYCRTLASAPCERGYYHIAEVRWTLADGTPGRSTLHGMVNWLRADLTHEAYSRAPSGQTARVYLGLCGAHPYIETFVDNTKWDNLANFRIAETPRRRSLGRERRMRWSRHGHARPRRETPTPPDKTH